MSSTSTRLERTSVGSTDLEEQQKWLKEQAEIIQTKINSAAKDMIHAGAVLLNVRDSIEHGKWESWVTEEVGIEVRSAQNFMNGARLMIGLLGDDWEEHDILASHTAIYALAAKNVPEEAREKALKVIEQKQYLTRAMVTGIVDGVKRAAEMETMLDGADPEVIKVAREHEVNPEVIPTLTIMKEQDPSAWAELKASGCVYYGAEPIPLGEANRRDIEDQFNELRFETRMSKLGLDPDRVIRGVMDAITMSALEAPHELAHMDNPGLTAIMFSKQDSLDTIARSLELCDGQPLVLIAAVNNANYRVSDNGKTPEWLEEMMEKIANA